MKLLHIFFVLPALFLFSCSDDGDGETIVVDKNDSTYAPDAVKKILDEEQHAAFRYFYDGADKNSGMALEGNERGTTITIGGSGFGMMAIIVGTERGWVTRAQGAEHVLKMARFLNGAERYKGVWAHWYIPQCESVPFGDQVETGDLVESSFMVAGLLTAIEYFKESNAVETEIRETATSLCNSIEWNAYTGGKDVLHWLWYSQEDKLSLEVKGWNECMETYLLALGAPEAHCISPEVYQSGWLSNGSKVYPNRDFYGYPLPLGNDYGGPLFFAHYSFLGFNPRLMQDEFVYYWRQNQAHALINRHYCLNTAPEKFAYTAQNWGLSACYGAGTSTGYKARSPLKDDGVIAPTAALASYPYVPFYATQVLMNLNKKKDAHGAYGFCDSYSPSENAYERKHLAIDQGPIVVMIENYRTGLIWNLFMKSDYAKRALQRAGMESQPKHEEGFYLLLTSPQVKSVDLMAHPDRGAYEIDFYSTVGGSAKCSLIDAVGNKVVEKNVSVSTGGNVFSIGYDEIKRGKEYQVVILLPSDKTIELGVVLH